jgi:nucleotide-binding universal stress UspA family protein
MTMDRNNERRLVVAGVSTFDSHRPLVAWAAAEAAARGAELRLLTARPGPAASDQYPPSDPAPAYGAAAERELTEMAAYVSTGWPGLVVSTELVAGPPAAVLRAAAEDADLLVVGADDASPFTEAISGSVPGDLLATAPCPLAVVPREAQGEWAESTLPASAPVVVALDEHGTAQAAVTYAFATAARSGRPLTVLHCLPPGPHDSSISVARALIGFRELYPDVAVTDEIVHGDPRYVLTDISRNAALLVLGSRGRGRLASGLFGSVSRYLIRHGGCPVVVARPHQGSQQHAAAAFG